MKLRTIQSAPIKRGARVILRADFDVAMKNGRVVEDFRIKANISTIRYLLKKGAHIRIIAHLGRPHGKIDMKFSLRPVARRLSALLKKKIIFVSDPFRGDSFEKYDTTSDMVMFENLRFWRGEERNDVKFARALAQWGDVYINEAFANVHRAHASMVALTRILPSFAGFVLAKEIFYLGQALKSVSRPLAVLVGGAKLETKLPVIREFLKRNARVLVGTALSNTFFLAQGMQIGRSVVDRTLVPMALQLLKNRQNLFLPVDIRMIRGSGKFQQTLVVGHNMKKDQCITDIGPKTVRGFSTTLKSAKTIVWSGTVGVAEQFPQGTRALAETIRRSHAMKIVGGGDTIAFLHRHKLLHGFTHVSTGGGAMLEFLAGKKLPGIEALKKSKIKNQNGK